MLLGIESMSEEILPSGLSTRPESLESLIAGMTPEIYQRLKSAVELGKWLDGTALSEEQLEQTMQLVILYEAQRLPDDQRTGAPIQSACNNKDSVDELSIITTDQETD